jgi:hypothetical protein
MNQGTLVFSQLMQHLRPMFNRQVHLIAEGCTVPGSVDFRDWLRVHGCNRIAGNGRIATVHPPS